MTLLLLSILFVLFGILFWIRRYVASLFVRLIHAYGGSLQTAIWLYTVLTLPGVLLHEAAHFFVATIIGLRTGSIFVLPKITQDGGVEFGSVQVEKSDPFRQLLVGIAPLLFGIPLVIWLSTMLISSDFLNLTSLLTRPVFWFGAYVLTTISLHILPSKRDLASWPIVVLILGIFITAAYMVGLRLPFIQHVLETSTSLLHRSVVSVSYSLMFTALWIFCTKLLLVLKKK